MSRMDRVGRSTLAVVAALVLAPIQLTLLLMVRRPFRRQSRESLGKIAQPLPRSRGSSAAVELFGIRVNATTTRAVIDRIIDPDASGARCVCFVNAECLNLACREAGYAQVLKEASLRLPDGIGVRLAASARGQAFPENVNGTDLFPRLCKSIEGGEESLFLLGGRPGTAEAVRRWISRSFPGTRVAGTQHGYFDDSDSAGIAARISESGATILLTALGAPKQELWNARWAGAAGVRVALGVGGLFDFYSGRLPRAPQWMRQLGLEWAFRLVQEPRRLWRRYLLGNALFLFRVLRARWEGATP